jgi:hypothetical protein
MELERQATLPLLVGHLEEVYLRHRARDVEEGVDAAECAQSLIDDGLRGSGLGQINIYDQFFRSSGLHGFRRLFQISVTSRDEDERGEVAREADGR